MESEIPLITQDEANALRYAAGYVPFALKNWFSKRLEIVAFLSSLGREGVESSFLEYTKEWVKHVNLGGLFQVNDEVFCLFVEIEMKLRRHLQLFLLPPLLFRLHILPLWKWFFIFFASNYLS